MSITPIDGSGGRTESGGSSADGSDSDGLLARSLRRAKAALVRGVTALRRLVRSDDTVDGLEPMSETSSRSERKDGPHPLDRIDTSRETGDASRSLESGDPVTTALPDRGTDNLPSRKQPFTQPARSSADENPPDLEATLEDDELTVELPGESEARITSDVWERAEP